MKLDATKIILILVGLLQSAIIYIGTDIQARLNRLEFKIEASVKAGSFDSVADFFAEKDSLNDAERRYLEYILEKSE